jgi:hypothetical protein
MKIGSLVKCKFTPTFGIVTDIFPDVFGFIKEAKVFWSDGRHTHDSHINLEVICK